MRDRRRGNLRRLGRFVDLDDFRNPEQSAPVYGADHALRVAIVAERAPRLAQLLRQRGVGDRPAAP